MSDTLPPLSPVRAEFAGGVVTACELRDGTAVLTATHDDDLSTFWVRAVLDGQGRVAGFKLTAFYSGVTCSLLWDPVTHSPLTCSCGRPAPCRHAAALSLALAGLARRLQSEAGPLLAEV
jgi:hypothetical protein